MCGIVGYLGPKSAIPILVSGLEKLEYRGYDSTGVATIENNNIQVYRAEGKLSRLKDVLNAQGRLDFSDTKNGKINVGIGHTRWATHGRPSEKNAHPHTAGSVCVVHNGIFENYLEVKNSLIKEGHKFASDTDTETSAHLIDKLLPECKSLLEAVRKALTILKGSYSLVVTSTKYPDTIVIAKNSTPLVIGLAEGETFIASDIPALLEHTRKVLILEDGEIAEITPKGVSLEMNNKAIKRDPITVTWDAITAEKGGFRHFMLKEIYEQPQVVADTFRGRIDAENGDVFLEDVLLSDEELKSIDKVSIVACGTARHAGLVAQFYIERLAKIPVYVDYGSEYRYRMPVVDSKTLFLAISQSGETADTLGSLQLAAEVGAKTIAICNVVGSSIPRKAKNIIYTHAGPEISVASTKAFVTQLTASYLLAIKLGVTRGTLTKAEAKKLLDDLIHLPSHISDILKHDKEIEKIAKKHGNTKNIYMFLGRGMLYPIALEGALKMKEISYLPAEGYPAGEMKHGPISLITEETPVVFALGEDGVNYEKTLSNIKEVESRGGQIIIISDIKRPEFKDLSSDVIIAGEISPMLMPIVFTVPMQLLAYHTAVYRGTDVDQPRNLAKSVTVE